MFGEGGWSRMGVVEEREGRGERYGVVGVGKFAHVSNFDWILDVLYIKYWT